MFRCIKITLWAFLCFFLCLVFSIYLTLPDVKLLVHENPKTTAFIELWRAQRKKEDFKLQWDWVKLDLISPFLLSAVVRCEDPYFWSHHGVCWVQIKHALVENLCSLSFRRGGSTITQQVAKNLYLSPSKNLVRKLREWFIARELEHYLTKQRILEIYLNIAEWGDGIFGIEAASRYRFNKSPSKLTQREARYLALILPSPVKLPSKEKMKKLDDLEWFNLEGVLLKGREFSLNKSRTTNLNVASCRV